MTVISIFNNDGGPGKTTTALHIASYMATNGTMPMLIDLDPQAVMTKRLVGDGGAGELPTIADALLGSKYVVQTVDDPLARGGEPSQFLLVPSSSDLSVAASRIQAQSPNHHKLKAVIRKFDWHMTLIDNGPGLDVLTVNMMYASDWVIIPIRCDEDASSDAARVIGMVDDMCESLDCNIKIAGVVLTHVSTRTIAYKSALGAVGKLGLNVLGEISNRIGDDRHDYWREDYKAVGKNLMTVIGGAK